MAGETKQLGTLKLDSRGVIQTIDEVNRKLASLGQGVNLDLTNLLNAKVNTQLANLKKQIEEVSKAATGQAKSQQDLIKKAADLRVEQLRALQDLEKHKVSGSEWDRLQAKVTATSKAFNEFTNKWDEKALTSVASTEKVIKAQEKQDSLVNKTRDTARQQAAEQETKMQLSALEQRTEAIRKAAQAEQQVAEARKQQYLDDVKASKQATEQTLRLIEEKRAANQKAIEQERTMTLAALEMKTADARKAAQEQESAYNQYLANEQAYYKQYYEEAGKAEQAYYEQVRDSRLEIINLQKQLDAPNIGANQKAYLEQQLNTKTQAYNNYSAAIRQQVETDSKVLSATAEAGLAHARALDQEAQRIQQEQLRIQQQQEQYANRIGNLFVSKVGMAVISTLKEQWSAAIDYATTYYDKLNEIRVVTDKTEAEAAAMGETFRKLAKEMKVTSTELSQAAVTFYRQGLSDTEVNKRLEWVTKYAKVANIDFETAAQLVTAATNSMSEDIQGDVQRVVDVFLYLGDAAATSGEEIGTAMQKASASATEFGLSFEWLGAYIATVSEQTRQAPESIGNAFNTMLARMHQIKSSGFNSEDETRINDVAKALATIDVELMDSAGQWRDMDKIYTDIANQWENMDAKQRAYIATTMAGTRQQNVFYALMNDMSKGIENGSRAWKLYSGAMEAAGTATKKYAIYQESVEAAQANLQNSLDALYSSFSANLLKDWYNGLADFIGLIAKGTEATGGFNVALGAVIAVLGAFTIATVKAGSTAAVFQGILTGLAAHPIIAAIMGATALITALTAAIGAFSSSDQSFEQALEKIDEVNETIPAIQQSQSALNAVFVKLSSGVDDTSGALTDYTKELNDVAKISPIVSNVVDDLRNGFISEKEAIEQINEALDAEIEKLSQARAQANENALTNYTNGSNYQNMYGYLTTDLDGNIVQPWFGDIDKNFDPQMIPSSFQTYLSDQLGSNYIDAWYAKTYEEQKAMAEQFVKYVDGLVKEVLPAEANQIISYVIGSIGENLNSTQEGFLRNRIMEFLMGDDGTLDIEDLAADRIQKDTQAIIRFAKQAAEEQADEGFSNEEYGFYVLKEIASTLFGTDALSEIEETLTQYANEEGFADAVASAYEAQIAAGISNVDIASLFASLPISEWRDGLGHALDQFDLSADFWESLDWGTTEVIDKETEALIYNLMTLGKTVEDIEKCCEGAQSLEDFKNKLKAMSGAAKQANQDFEQTPKTTKEYIKDIASYTTQVEKIQSLIDHINTYGQLDMDKVLDIAEGNPEILMYIRNLTEMQKKLEEIKKDLQETQIHNAYSDLILNDESAFNSSRHASYGKQYGVNTLSGLISHFKSDSFIEKFGQRTSDLQVAFVEQEVATLVARLMEATDAANELGDALDDLEPDDSAEKAYMTDLQANLEATKNYAQWIDALDKTSSSYDPTKVLDAYTQLENIFPELKEYERGTADYMERAKQLVAETTDEIYAQAAAWGVVTDLQAKTAQYADNAQKQKTFQGMDSDNYLGAINYLEKVMMDQRESIGEGIVDSWKNALSQLDEQGVLQGMVGMFGDIYNLAEECGGGIEEIIAKLMELRDAAQNMGLEELAQQIKENIEAASASTYGYQEQVNQIANALAAGGVEEAIAKFNGLSTTMKEGVAKQFPELILALNNAKKAEDALKDSTGNTEAAQKKAASAANALASALKNATAQNNAKYYENTNKAINSLYNGTMKARDALDAYEKDAIAAQKAIHDFDSANKSLAQGIAITTSDIQNLSSYLGGIDPQWLIDHWSEVGPMMSAALAEGEDAFRRLNEAAFINITGTSNVDFSDLEKGLITTSGLAQETLDELLKLGLFEVENVELDTFAWVWEGTNLVLKKLQGMTQIIKPKASNPLSGTRWSAPRTASGRSSGSGSGGGSSGGGSGGSTTQSVSEIDRLLDKMKQLNDLYDHTQSIYKAQQQYYQQTGQLQGVIMYLEKEGQSLIAQNKILEENIAEIEIWIEAKKAELATLAVASEAYQTAAQELAALQQRHQEYTRQLINNRAAIEQINQSIKDQKNKIRDMEIELRNVIYKAIEDREALKERMLQGRINVENTILDLIQKRYEKERDYILENASKQIEMLEKEKDLLSEQLELRKQEAESQEKAVQLAELEAKYARIVADPTRKTEALALEKQIRDLRDDLSWETAEKELKKQQDAIDGQITTIEDYVAYVKEYYNDLFEHPKKLIAEMESIIVQTDADIIAWLQENSDEYAEATAAAQQAMVNSWQDLIMDMHGEIKTYWDEVEEIIAGGDEAIIQFLVENSADYKSAGKLQAQAYVEEWMEMLSNLKKAHMNVSEQMMYDNYAVIASANGLVPSGSNVGVSSSGGNSSGSSSGGSSAARSTQSAPTATVQRSIAPQQTVHGYSFYFQGRRYANQGYASSGEAASAGQAVANSLIQQARLSREEGDRAITGFYAYDKGGLATHTGPAWLDGTPEDPERVLSPRQTSLFESLVQSMEQMSKINLPALPVFGNDMIGSGNAINVGDIIVNVDKLENDDDYEELARKVFETIMEKMNRGAAIGGLRF